jgi:hypothetical protein
MYVRPKKVQKISIHYCTNRWREGTEIVSRGPKGSFFQKLLPCDDGEFQENLPPSQQV